MTHIYPANPMQKVIKSAFGLCAIAGLSIAFGASKGLAQDYPDIPEVVSPLQVETNFQGVNVLTGRMAVDTPVLQVPGAGRLSFSRVQNVAPYVVGRTQSSSAGEGIFSSYSIHTGGGSSASFTCFDNDCTPVNSRGAVLQISGHGNGRTFIYYEAGSGARWDFNVRHYYIGFQGQENYLSYASKATFTDGEVLSYTYQNHIVGERIYRRPTMVSTNAGYRLTLTYHSAQWGVVEWSRPHVVEMESVATSTVVGRHTYSSSGNTITDILGRSYQCTYCHNQLGLNIETTTGSLQLPGESSASFSATTSSIGDVVGSVSRNGISWSYSYSNFAGLYFPYRYDGITINGPNGIEQRYEFDIISDMEIRLTASIDPEGRRTEYNFDGRGRPRLVRYPEGNREEIDYDLYGNVLQRRMVAKPGSGLSNIVTSAVYPTNNTSLCNIFYVSPRCFRPLSVTDPKGNVTNYQYNDNGQVTQILAPADANQDRAKTVIVYSASAAGIMRPSTSTLCEEAQNCTTQGISQTRYIYWRDTALPSKVCVTDLATGEVLITEFTYDEAGRQLSATQPLGVTGGCS